MGLDQSLRIKEIDGRLVTTRKHKYTAPRALTQRDIEVLTDLFAVLKGVYGEEAKAYFRQYIRLYRHYRFLKRRRSEGKSFPVASRLSAAFNH